MDATRFDGFARTIAVRLTRRTGLGVLAGASLPLLGFSNATDAKKNKKITLCFNGQTVKKPKKKAKKLEKKGATRGACVNGCGQNQKPCGNTCIPIGDCCTNADCTSPQVCEAGSCAALRCGNGGPCKVFATAATRAGNLGSAAAGDTLCQAAADATPLPGTFRAWLSDNASTPATRFSKTANAGPYVLVGNIVDGGNPPPTVAANFASLTSCGGGGDCLQNPVNRTESGVIVNDPPLAWTGTLANGTVAIDTCANWNSNASLGVLGQTGRIDETGLKWTTQDIPNSCNTVARLYCFEQAT